MIWECFFKTWRSITEERKLHWFEKRLDQVQEDVARLKSHNIFTELRQIMATQEQVLEEVRKAKTVSESTNIAVKEALRLLKEGQSDPAKNDEAIALLQAIQADDNAVLTENTPEA